MVITHWLMVYAVVSVPKYSYKGNKKATQKSKHNFNLELLMLDSMIIFSQNAQSKEFP